MNKAAKNFRLCLLVLIYGVIVVAGSFLAAQGFYFFGGKSDTVHLVKSDTPPAWRVHTTQNRHLHLFPKLEIKPAAAVAEPPFPKATQLQLFYQIPPVLLCCFFKYYRYQPRDPPAA